MKKLSTILLASVLFSANASSQSITQGKVVPDDYFVTNDMLVDTSSNSSSYPRKNGEIFSFDKAWFTNDTLQQSLVFELYTDYHRLHIFHFYNNDIPSDLIKTMELYFSMNNSTYGQATDQQKEKYFNGFIKQGIRISQLYFTTKKGFKLGNKKEKAINIYGEPDSCLTHNGIEICYWNFVGDFQESEETRPKPKTNKPFAQNSFGYSTTMFFRNKKLIAMILNNDAP